MPTRIILASTILAFVVACHSIPSSTLQTPDKPPLHQRRSANELIAPKQKALKWDTDRWFEAEMSAECWGDIYFVDTKNAITSFVSHGNLPGRLVVLEAALDKNAARIGTYRILAPKDYQFRHDVPVSSQPYLKPIDNIETLTLPHKEGQRSRDACKKTMRLPPIGNMLSSKEYPDLVDWYEKTKQAHPLWATPDKELYMEELRIKYTTKK